MAVVFILFARGIFIDQRLIINIINDHIHVAIIIQIGIHGAVRKSRYSKAPVFWLHHQIEVAVVFKSIVRDFNNRYLVKYLFFDGNEVGFRPESHKIMIGNILRKTVGYHHIPKAIIIKIGNKGHQLQSVCAYAAHKSIFR